MPSGGVSAWWALSLFAVLKLLLFLSPGVCAWGGNATIVSPGLNTLSRAVLQADNHTTLVLGSGVYAETATIKITRPMTIRGLGAATIISVDSRFVGGAVFVLQNWNVSIEAISVQDVRTGRTCSLLDPTALRANFSINVTEAAVKEGFVDIVTDMGPWYSSRMLIDFTFGSCSAISHSDKFHNRTIAIWSNCGASFYVGIQFSKLGNCNVQITNFPTFTRYVGELVGHYREWVVRATPTTLLRVPTARIANAVTRLNMNVDRLGKVAATINVQYPSATGELQAAITRVDAEAISANESIVELSISLPFPFTVPSNATGRLNVTASDDWRVNTSLWIVSPKCTNVRAGGVCNQTLTFNITACDLTGTYMIMDLPIVCLDPASATCSLPKGGSANITFTIDTSEFCDDTEYTLDALFSLAIVLRPDQSFIGERPNRTFAIQETSFWSILIWTNETGVGIETAVVLEATRTVGPSSCTLWPNWMNPITKLDQMFVRGTANVPPMIHMRIPVNSELACPRANTNSSNVTLTFLVRVDYLDTTRRRRRRDVSLPKPNDYGNYYRHEYEKYYGEEVLRHDESYDREARAAETQSVSTDFGISLPRVTAAPPKGDSAQAKEEEQPPSDSTFMIVIAIASVLAALVCCFGIVLAVVWRWRISRTSRMKEKEGSLAGPMPSLTNMDSFISRSSTTGLLAHSSSVARLGMSTLSMDVMSGYQTGPNGLDGAGLGSVNAGNTNLCASGSWDAFSNMRANQQGV